MTNQQEAVIENLRTPPNDSCPPIVLLLGARNSGKSTFSRFFVNRMLRSHQAVMYLDCDLGQSEFMPPGFLSLTKRSVPIFGTPCCHLQKPEKAYFIGDTTCQRDPHYYLLCIKELYQLYNGKYSNFPLIVNTHGWLVGLGLMIIECICTIVNPSDIVLLAITEKEFTEKFSTLLNAKADYFGVVKERKRSFSKVTVTNIHAVEGYKRKRKSKTLKYKASFHRLMSLAVYFACCTPICFQAPYEVSLDDVQVELLYDVVAKTQHLCAINGNFVGLCVADKPGPKRPLECLGLAIVRAVDVGNRKLYINTPLDARELERVNVLQKGVIEIPIVMRTQGAYGHVPYTQQPVYSGSKGRRSVNRHIMGSGKKVNRLVKRKRLMRSR
ncbi:polynucleotide 5'-hydroxyl-kinase NOL9-like [Zophobas morio]|uniref:polynucleotide 5'-hydroxyl-kinase NOL9-like n=1 Tax=Zophobas morio TaxID=2755281 RepID=UPI0030837E9F